MVGRPRSGLQKEVLALYRRGLKNVMKKPEDSRENFLLHLRYNFRHPPLTPRDHSAIEHQIRKFTRTLEGLEESSVTRMNVSSAMWAWWDNEVDRAWANAAKAAMGAKKADTLSSPA